MKRSQSRAASPTPTAFSGISNYRNESYRPIRDKNVPAVPTIDYRQVSKIHFEELSRALAVYLAKASPTNRSTARQKLTRLTIQQFHELSTDVYDELIRRKKDKDMPFLPVREEFHPKRNQARQKLATLPIARFEDLSSDVYYELARRYPEFKEDPSGGRMSPGSTYDDYPAPDYPGNPPPRPTNSSRASGRASADRPSDSGYGGSVSSRRPSEDRRRPSEVEYGSTRRSEDNYGGGRPSEDGYTIGTPSSRRRPSITDDNYASNMAASRRRPSQDTTREKDYQRRPGIPMSLSGNSDATVNAQSTTAASGMIIPNKSTMEEEYIEVPYGRDARDSTLDDRERAQGGADPDGDSASDYPSPRSPRSPPPVGLSGLSARLKGAEDGDESELYDKPSRSGASSRVAGAKTSEEVEKLKKDYESKISTMQSQISTLQRDLGDMEQKDKKARESEAKVRQLEEDLQGFRRRAEEQSLTILAIQKELDDLREVRQREKEKESRRAREDEDELRQLRNRCQQLEQSQSNGGVDADIVEQLRADMSGLISELSQRNDELLNAKDADAASIRELDFQVKDYKRKYEQAKTELRSMKATSQLFLPIPKLDKLEDQLPASADGAILDIHVTAFLSAIDGLLTAGRSNAPTQVLTSMKSVVNAVTVILDDVRTFESRPKRDRSDIGPDVTRSLRERAEATLSNLAAASKTHATSLGLSPVSLLDAAASHLSATVTEICKTVSIRKATAAEQDRFSSQLHGPSASTGFTSPLRTVAEENGHRRAGSSVSARGANGRFTEAYNGARQRSPSENSSSDYTNSPPPIFDQPKTKVGIASDDVDGLEDNWAELKPYLEAQTESIVYAIQSVLSGVRSPTPSPTLNENLTQIITIVSSIVAVCTDNVPAASAQQGSDILKELSEHANKLSEVQSLPDVTKESRQVMAKSSFAIANAMKGLMKL